MNKRIKDIRRKNAYELLKALVEEQEEFTLVLWNNDDWDAPLPDDIMKDYPIQLVLNITNNSLKESYVDQTTGLVNLTVSFDGHTVYSKEVHLDDTIVIMDQIGQPYIVNNFEPEEESTILSTEEVKDLVIKSGVSEKAAKKSLNAFLKPNKKD